MGEEKLNFIIIDDSKLDCFIAEKIIRNTGRGGDIRSFTAATDALAHVTGNTSDSGPRTVIIVDIQMPIMNGFDFVEAFEKLPEATRARYIIYMLSSSINENDINRVQNYPSIKQFLNKPLTSNMLNAILGVL
ncbi:MAG TPA: response regulator [Flavipsychrobacter sp.]|nr:response regulator [Flavipsychrobacter sp.]